MFKSLGQIILSQIRPNIGCRPVILSTNPTIQQLSSSATTVTKTSSEITDRPSSEVIVNSDEYDKLYSKLEVELKSIDPAVLKSYSWFAVTSANHLDIEVGDCWSPRKSHKKRLTLLKSVFIYRKHRVQYEIRTYYRYLNFHKLTESTLNTFLEYIQRNLPEGVAMKATKVEIQSLPDHLKIRPPDVQ